MTEKHDWFWYELITPDPQAAAKFYSEVVGWKITSYPMAEDAPAYLVGNAGDLGVVGIMGRQPGMPAGSPPFWSGYLHTLDTDATAKSVKDSGGKVFREPFDIGGVGRIAVLGDPEGGLFNAMKPEPQTGEGPPKLGDTTPGHVSWCELHSDNPEQNFAWYEKQFGWKRGDSMDMGKDGTYQMFTTNDLPVTGGSCGKMGGQMPTHWLFYFFVDGIDAAIERTKQAGGNIFMGAHEVPGGTWIALGTDPQGATFALHSTKK